MNAPTTEQTLPDKLLLSEPIRPIETSVSDASEEFRDKSTARWQEFLDVVLIQLGLRANEELDDECPAPTRQVVGRACDVARQCRDAGYPPPTNVHCDADGGIVFERVLKNGKEVIHVWDDGLVEVLSFVDRRLVDRFSLALPESE